MKKLYEEENIRAIAEALRLCTPEGEGEDATYTVEEMSGAVEDITNLKYNVGWSEGYRNGYDDGYDDGYSDGQALFLTDFADWDIALSDMEATVVITNLHDSHTLNLTVKYVEPRGVKNTWELTIAPNSYKSVRIQADVSDYHIEIDNMYFSVTGG